MNKNKTLTLGSLFDGSGGFPLAGTLCGITPIWASEVEPYPIAVTKSRFPDMKHLGDISKINGDGIKPVDIITFGSPCQDLSVAGKRAGLKHISKGDQEISRSGLFLEAIRIIKEMRKATDGKYPSYAVWENVPGAFSSNKGEDFRIVLEEFIKIVEPNATVPPADKRGWPYSDLYLGDGWSLAYRTLDAQYWGVPQRRRRIYLVFDFTGGSAGEILFKRDGLRRDFEEIRKAWKTSTGNSKKCPENPDFSYQEESLDSNELAAGFCPEVSSQARGIGYELEKCPTLRAGAVPAVVHKVYAVENNASDCRCKLSGKNIIPTLRARMGTGGNNVPLVLLKHTLSYGIGNGQTNQSFLEEIVGPLNCMHDQQAITSNGVVRRLTPVECARLQGFPDWWGYIQQKEVFSDDEYIFWQEIRNTHASINGKNTKDYSKDAILKWYNKLHTDSSEYKMWGNGIALPTALYVMEGISERELD